MGCNGCYGANVTGLSTKQSLFHLLELLMVIMLGTFTFKAFYWKDMGGASHEWYEHPLVMLAILLITALVSMFGYIKLVERLGGRRGPE
jgi:hypothetical protein